MTVLTNSRGPAKASTRLMGLVPLYAANLVSQSGNWLFRAAAIYCLYEGQGDSTAVLSGAVILAYVPVLLGARYLAPVADRVPSRLLLSGLDLLRAALLAPLLWLGNDRSGFAVAWTLLAITLLSLSSPLFTAGQSAYIRSTVSSDELPRALAGVTGIEWLTFTVGTSVGASLLLSSGIRTVVAADIVSFLASSVILASCLRRGRATPVTRLTPGVTTDPAPRSARIRYVVASIFVLNLGAGVINLYPTIVARDFAGAGRPGLSSLYLANGIGGILGAMLAAGVGRRVRPSRLMAMAASLVVVSLIGMTQVRAGSLPLLASSSMLLFGQVFAVAAQTELLTLHPPAKAARASGLFIGATFAGVAANALIAAAFVSGGAADFVPLVVACASAVGLSLLPARLAEHASLAATRRSSQLSPGRN